MKKKKGECTFKMEVGLNDLYTNKLMELRDPDTKKPMVDCVYKREDLFQGKFVNDAPDLLIAWKDYKYWVNLDLNINLDKSIGSSTEDQRWPDV